MGVHTGSLQQDSSSKMATVATEVKLFNKYSFEEVTVNDMALVDYIAAKPANANFLPHTAGRWSKKRFKKAQCPIVERVTNSLMMHGRNNGKKIMAVRIMKHTCDIIHLLTGENPIQVIVDAVVNSGASLRSSSTPPRARPTRTPSRRRTRSSAWPRPTGKFIAANVLCTLKTDC